AQYRHTNASQPDRVDPKSSVTIAPLLEARGPDSRIIWPDRRNLALTYRLAGVALIVLIIATSNVASLLLMRALNRTPGIAIRLALGVSHGRLIRQMITEGMILSAVAGVAGIFVASMGGAALGATLFGIRRGGMVDHRVFLAGLAIAVGAGLLASCAPLFV